MGRLVEPTEVGIRAVPSREAAAAGPRARRKPGSGLGTLELGELINRARDGERAAAAELYERYHRFVAKTLIRIVGPEEEIADLLQETFVRVLNGLRSLRHTAGFSSWLRRVTTTTAMDHLRRRRSKRWLLLLPPESLPEPVASERPDDLREALRLAYAILGSMAVEDRTVFALRFLSGLELQEVAHATDCSLATAKRRLKRARQRFMAQARRSPVLSEWVAEQEARSR